MGAWVTQWIGSWLVAAIAMQPLDGPGDPARPSAERLASLLDAVVGDHADPAVAIAPLRLVDASAAEQAWNEIKAEPNPRAQAQAIRARGVEREVCTGLVDFRDVVRTTAATFEFRDDLRGRSWIRPALARVLVRALVRYQEEYPATRLTIGDIAQIGCGQIAYGSLVRQVRDDDGARDLVRRARRVLGEPMVVERASAADFPAEADRFDRPDSPVLVERRIVGRSADWDAASEVVRVAVRRFTLRAPARRPARDRRAEAAMLKGAERLIERGEVVRHEAVQTWDPAAGVARTAYVHHRVDRAHGRQVQIIAHRPLVAAIDLKAVVEIRTAAWRAGKPESFAGEVRWRPQRDDAGDVVGWQRWQMLGEAGHLSHLSGRDADVSFATVDNRGMQRVRVKKIDAVATWRWFEILVDTAAELGTPIDQVLVGPQVKGWLGRKVGPRARGSDLWRLVLVSARGHDGHHHIRLRAPTAADDAHALADLQGDPERTAAGL